MVNPRERLNDIRDRAASARDRVTEAREQLESELDTFTDSTGTQRTVNYDTSQDVFDSKRAAERRAAELGISGSHKVGDDQYRPGRTAGEYQQAIGRVVEEIEQGDRSRGSAPTARTTTQPGVDFDGLGLTGAGGDDGTPGVDFEGLGAFADSDGEFSDVGVFDTDDDDRDDLLSGDDIL